MRSLAILTLALLTLSASSAMAQVVQLPPRPSRPLFGGGQPPDPDHARQALTLDANLLGGYDDNAAPLGPFAPSGTVSPGGYAGLGDVTLKYGVGSTRRGLEINGHGYANSSPSLGLQPSFGSDVSASVRTKIGRDTDFTLFQRVERAPYTSPGLFGVLQGTAGITNPESNLANALIGGRTLNIDSATSVGRQWTRRTRTTARYVFNKRTAENRALLDDSTHSGGLGFDRQIGRTAALNATYSLSHTDLARNIRRVRSSIHSADVGLAMSRRISRTRTLALSGGGGAQHVDAKDTVRQMYWAPSAYGSLRVDVGRSWNVSVDYRQSTTALPAPVFNPNTFLAHAFVLSAGGYAGGRFELVFNTGYSSGVVAGATADSPHGAYEGYTGTGQLRVRLIGSWSALMSVNHYQSRLSGVAAELLQASPRLDRNSVRVGLSGTVPLFDSMARGRVTQGGGN